MAPGPRQHGAPAGEDVIDLAREELREMGRSVTHAAGDPEEPFGLYAFPASAAESELARAVERRVFAEWFGNPPELLDAEYGPYEDATIFLCALDHRRGLPAGMVRLILPSPAGAKSLHDIEQAWGLRLDDVYAATGIAPPVDSTLDIVTIAVDREYRGAASDGLISMGLYQAIVQALRYGELQWIVTILDLVVLDLIDTLASTPFRRYRGVEPHNYLDSPASLPVYCDVPEWLARLEAADPVMFGILHEATGLEGAMRPVGFRDARLVVS